MMRVAFNLGGARPAQRVEVALVVLDVADREADDRQAHVGQVGGGDFLNALGERFAVLIHLFHGHRAEDGAQMAFERLRGDASDFVGGLAQELFGRGGESTRRRRAP